MTNPLLGDNLGRWAHVYFTTPPEKREQAIRELLQELKATRASLLAPAVDENRERDGPKAVESIQEEAASLYPRESLDQSAEPPQEVLVCGACLYKNKAGQKFCGLCGFRLRPDPDPSEPTKVRDTRPERPNAVERDAGDWAWLHERNASEFIRVQRNRSTRSYLTATAALLTLVIVAYALWWRRAEVSYLMSPSPKNQRSTPAALNKEWPAQGKSTAQTGGPAEGPAGLESTTTNGNTTAGQEKTLPPPEQRPTVAGATLGTKSAESGKEELERGRRYLEGQGVPKNSTLAAIWLWKAVSKQNVDATLLLSDLYVRGDGVPQSCDQARLLLRAAAKRESSAAGEKLRAIDGSICK